MSIEYYELWDSPAHGSPYIVVLVMEWSECLVALFGNYNLLGNWRVAQKKCFSEPFSRYRSNSLEFLLTWEDHGTKSFRSLHKKLCWNLISNIEWNIMCSFTCHNSLSLISYLHFFFFQISSLIQNSLVFFWTMQFYTNHETYSSWI